MVAFVIHVYKHLLFFPNIYYTLWFSVILPVAVCSPVLVSSKHLEDGAVELEKPGSGAATERVLRPMRWGLIPSWYHGEVNAIEYKMNNARSDGMLVKTSFKKPLQSGRRCVVLADGYVAFVFLQHVSVACYAES